MEIRKEKKRRKKERKNKKMKDKKEKERKDCRKETMKQLTGHTRKSKTDRRTNYKSFYDVQRLSPCTIEVWS